MDERKSLCPFCGLGCRLRYLVSERGVVGVSPDPEDPVSRGRPCLRGLSVHETMYRGRLKEPMARREKGRRARPVSWGSALTEIAERIRETSPEHVYVAVSGRIPNEDAFALVKLSLAVIGSPNVDSISRVCHAPTVAVMREVFGLPASTGRLDDIERLDALLLAATNPAVDYPPFHARIQEARRRGLRVVYVGSLRSETFRQADAGLLVRPGGEPAVFNYMARRILESGSFPEEVRGLDGFKEYVSWVSGYDEGRAREAVLEGSLEEAVETVASSRRLGVASGVGLTQRAGAAAALYSLYDLALLKKAVILTQRGLVNVQGVGDVGACPGLGCWPEENRRLAEDEWGPLPRGGASLTEAVLSGRSLLLILTDMNPLHSMPATREVEKTLERSFVVCMCSYYSETAAYADVLLPTPLIPEREGSITTGERRVRPLRPVAKPYGEAMQEWVIASKLAGLLGSDKLAYGSVWEITEEISRIAPGYSGVSSAALRAGEDQWASKKPGRGRFVTALDNGPIQPPEDRPWLLVTLRSRQHFLGGEATWKSRRLARAAEPQAFFFSEEDYEGLGLQNVRVKVCSEAGCIEAPAMPSRKLPRGVIGYHLHHRAKKYNLLVPASLSDFDAPTYRFVPVKVYCAGLELRPLAESLQRCETVYRNPSIS